MHVPASVAIALRALSRNKLQTALTTVGMTIGVATVLTMIALGTGAEAAIQQQVRAAGMNLIIVTAGNYKPKTEQDDGGVVDHQARLWREAPLNSARGELVEPRASRRSSFDGYILSERLILRQAQDERRVEGLRT